MNRNVLLVSESAVKVEAFEKAYGVTPVTIAVSGDVNPEQPVGRTETLVCCKRRIESVIEMKDHPNVLEHELKQYDYLVAIENGIVQDTTTEKTKCYDFVYVVIYDTKKRVYYCMSGGHFQFNGMLWADTRPGEDDNCLGWPITIGETVAEKYGYNPKNWSKDYDYYGAARDRVDLIADVLKRRSPFKPLALRPMDLRVNINYIPDHPIKGVLFQDLTPIWSNGTLNMLLFKEIRSTVSSQFSGFDVIVGLESRGFGIGHALATQLGKGFVMVRKPGKLVGPVYSVSYEKEYGSDTVELQCNAIPKGSRVLIVDDLLATGGSLWAACQLVAKVPDVKIVGCFTILRVRKLVKAAKKKLSPIRVVTLLIDQPSVHW